MPTAGSVARLLAPAAVLAVVAGLDLTIVSKSSIATLVVVAPLIAASLLSPVLTGAYGLAALAVWYPLAIHDGQFAGVLVHASLIRGVGIAIGTALGVLAAIARRRRETQFRLVRRVAEVAQQSILRPPPARIGAANLSACYRSSAHEANVGGDFYGVVDTPWGVRTVIGDVRGKGLDAVRLAADVLGAFRERAVATARLDDLLEQLNDATVRSAPAGDFVTAELVQIDASGGCTVVSAGHPMPVLVRAGTARLLRCDEARPPLGFTGDRVQPIVEQLRPADLLVLYTDGVTEARRRGTRAFFEPELLRTLEGVTGADEATASLSGSVSRWTHDDARDDMAVVALHWDPQPDVVATTPPDVARPGTPTVNRERHRGRPSSV